MEALRPCGLCCITGNLHAFRCAWNGHERTHRLQDGEAYLAVSDDSEVDTLFHSARTVSGILIVAVLTVECVGTPTLGA